MIEKVLLSLGVALVLGLVVAATWERATFKRSIIKWFAILFVLLLLAFNECFSFPSVGEHDIDVFGLFLFKFTPEWLTYICVGVLSVVLSLGFDYMFGKKKEKKTK